MVFEAVERVKPTRVVLDSLSEIRLLAQSSLRYRRQLLAMKHYLRGALRPSWRWTTSPLKPMTRRRTASLMAWSGSRS